MRMHTIALKGQFTLFVLILYTRILLLPNSILFCHFKGNDCTTTVCQDWHTLYNMSIA